VHLLAEDERNLAHLALPRDAGGYGLDGIWADDFHHLMRNLTAGDAEGYFADFAGTTAADVAATLRQGWFYTGQEAPHYGGPRGTDPAPLRPEQFVLCIQNHDQVGNRPQGRRLADAVDLATYRAASATLLFAPEVPLVFMGQEWAATTPFQYFTDHNDELGPLVTEGRKEEFADFPGFEGEVPDPQAEATFRRSQLDWAEVDRPPHDAVCRLYRALLHLRRELRGRFEARAHGDRALEVRRGPHRLLVAFEAGAELPLPEGADVVLTTEDDAFAPDPQPPTLEGRTARFARPGALVVASHA
jgi:maltooligosyltrehalose trehalohydrolase